MRNVESSFIVDINADLGESYGAYTLGHDETVMTLITSANVACGMHAGDPRVMDATVKLTREYDVSVGAHPGFPDLVGFGRRVLDATPRDVETDVVYQLGALEGFCRRHGTSLQHVKAHGALYNVGVVNPSIAGAIATAVASYRNDLIFVAPFGSALAQAGAAAGLTVAYEAFADRAYNSDGTLVSRRLPGAIILEPAEAAERALQIVQEGTVMSLDGATVPLQAHTICVHGDNPNVVEILREIRSNLERHSVGTAAMRTVLTQTVSDA